MSKEKLAYFINGSEVRIVLHTADAKAEISPADTVAEAVFDSENFAHDFQSNDGTKTLLSYGLVKILQDRTSQVTESLAKKFEAMQAEAQRLQTANEDGSYNWKNAVVRAESKPRSAKKVDSYIAQAVAELKGISISQATEALKALTAEQIGVLSAKEGVKNIVARLKAEATEQTEQMDLADLLG